MADFILQYVYALDDFDTVNGEAVPDEGGADAAGTPPYNLQLNAGVTASQLTVTDDDDAIFNETNGTNSGQSLQSDVTIGGVTYTAGSSIFINYVITTDDGFEGYSITIGGRNSGNNDTTLFVTNEPMVPGQLYEFTSEDNIGNNNGVPYTTFACFTLGAMILTPNGERLIETLNVGDLVKTRDHGAQPIRWIGKRMVPAIGKMAPVTIRAGTLGASADLTVSPNHRMLLTGAVPQLLLGQDEVLVTAKSLVNGSTIVQMPRGFVTYIHLMFDRHEIICANGNMSESFFAGPQAVDTLDRDQFDEIATLFPELGCGGSHLVLARPAAKQFEGRVMMAQLSNPAA